MKKQNNNTKLPAGWSLMINSKKNYAPRSPFGTVYECINPSLGLWNGGGTKQEAINHGWSIYNEEKAYLKRTIDWKEVKK